MATNTEDFLALKIFVVEFSSSVGSHYGNPGTRTNWQIFHPY